MRKICLAIVLLGGLAILLTAMNQSFINRIKQDRYFDHLTGPGNKERTLYDRIFIRSDRWRYGDLYGLCYLPGYKFELEPYRKYRRDSRGPATNRIIYIIGDSFLADKELSGAFAGFDSVVFLDSRFPFGPLALDTGKENFLVLEFAERNLNDFDFRRTNEVKWNTDDQAWKSSLKPGSKSGTDANTQGPTWKRLGRILFNKELSRNLETLLFDDRALTPVKEIKAAINYKIAGSMPKEVTVSTDKTRLLMNATVDIQNRQSAFRTVGHKELAAIINNLDQAQRYYHKIGFKAVALSVIPNPVSVYDPRRMNYNHLLERVETETTLPVISVFQRFRTAGQNLYYRSDSHWNPAGLDSWVASMNKKQIYLLH